MFYNLKKKKKKKKRLNFTKKKIKIKIKKYNKLKKLQNKFKIMLKKS